jgi:putative FmdB family regulatory protein
MPTYEYECTKCHNVQEEFHSILTTPAVKCLICKEACEKIFSVNGNFVLKGGDWPSQGFRLKQQMLKKNERMKNKMTERTNAGQGITRSSQLIKN